MNQKVGFWSEASIAAAVLASCKTEIQALKPGNVSIHSAGHGMVASDFLASAEEIAPILASGGTSVGEKILYSVQATRKRVGCNTNLGIVLLCAPMCQAMLTSPPGETLEQGVTGVLRGLNREDARLAYQAIALANPGGLGRSAKHDVSSVPRISLLQAMAEAQERDRIAWQYAHDFHDIFHTGLPVVQETSKRWKNDEDSLVWAAVACYLSLLGSIPDTHIKRKFGEQAAERVCMMAARVESRFKACENTSLGVPLLRQFDGELKREGINPGTSADLTVASLLAYHLDTLSCSRL